MSRTFPLRWRIIAWVFSLLRPLFVSDIDPNEDFVCGECARPVLRRYLYCSAACANHLTN